MDPKYEASVLSVLRSEGVVALADQFEVARYLSKTGTFKSDEQLLRFIAPLLSQEEVIALHRYLKGFRDESEWREEFEDIFAAHADALPEFDPI